MCLYSDAMHDIVYYNFLLLFLDLSTRWMLIIALF
jgi:hypothetical protein